MTSRKNQVQKREFADSYFSARNSSKLTRNRMYQRDLQYLDKIFKKVRFNKIDLVLDVGCSEGTFSNLIKEKFSCQVHGIEVNRNQAKLAKKVIDKVYNSLFDMQFSKKYDLIVLRGTLHYLTAEELERILEFGRKGCLIIFLQNPNRNSLPVKLIGETRIKFITPTNEFKGNTLIYNRKMLKDKMIKHDYFELDFSWPYFKTPYFKPTKDIVEFFKLFSFKGSLYNGSLPGNIFRASYQRNIHD